MADVVSTGEAFSSTDAQRETWAVTTEVAGGTALINNGRAGVAYTASGGYTGSVTLGPLTLSGIPQGGASLGTLRVSVATDGAYEFAVTGAGPSTANGTPVYAIVGSGGSDAGRITGLTLTAATNTLWGHVFNPESYVAESGVACVKIGGATVTIVSGG